MPSIQLPGTGYAKLVLHACKHPTVAVNGILIGRLDGKVRYDTFFFSSPSLHVSFIRSLPSLCRSARQVSSRDEMAASPF